MYAVQLASGQSLTVASAYSGNQPLVYNGPGSGTLTVILTQAQYNSLNPSALSAVTDVSNPGLPVLHVAIPTTAKTFVQGSFAYCGYSCGATATTAIVLQDNNGGGTGLSGTAPTAQPIEYINLAASASLSIYYPPGAQAASGGNLSAIPISDGPFGGLSTLSASGTFTGVVRICGR